MEPVNLLLVGCGMMGARHLRGLAELERAAPGGVRLVGVCDLREEAAQAVADEAAELMGERPAVFTDLEKATAELPDLQAADVVTEPRSHDSIAVGLMEAGVHVICEKPLSLTIARGRRMLEAAERTGRVLATAENNRHDPMNRLARACIAGGLLGEPNFVMQISLNPVARITGTTWRHRRAMGGVLMDVGIHQGYMLEYLLGPIETVSATAQLVAEHRTGKEYDGTEAEVDVDVEDCFTATLQFASGVQGQWTVHFASPGETMNKRLVMGSEGTADLPGDRSGRPVQIRRGQEVVEGEALLAELPDWRLNEVETRLFGERPASYSLQSVETDRKLIAAEMASFVAAVREGARPEADGALGLRSVAVISTVMESATAGRPVAVEEVLSGELHAWQDTVEGAALRENDSGEGRDDRT
ncbi:MAG: Gfo/Idh/MocA family oxidoreductase [Armatimonadetes bacterium]|nr:Gfo/Idh/MocA family oxidoreductase [Armatimonadota bacterium]